ncbi:MBL fold metallo-hydrolase [Texcoconibacillus texcoconensis]|uniref:Ribonuclease BN (tRNA processing enzyme) n=1 Tax=Texcoconibacillus texcoconensis TaxID=1095777 RepID=A0A840QSM9_9BACI|nr:MBL fold metallo-hydrolase [Texcoconibacillus texcoconensis]MBB5174375.1 ribonuclease BN (tRNA processing enzyme) [Texcoconibacillus texcoconensis]
MKLTIIGHWGAYPEAGEATSSYLIEDENTKLLLDCGSASVSTLQQYTTLEDIDAVLLSHHHHDHVADLGVLKYSRIVSIGLGNTNENIPVYSPAKESEDKRTPFKGKGITFHTYQETDQLLFGNIQVTFQKTIHPSPCYAMRVEQLDTRRVLTYTADTSFDASLSTFAAHSDILIAESSFYDGQDATSYGHLTSTQAATIADQAFADTLVLTHLPHFGDKKQLVTEAATVFAGNIELAQKGKQLSI